MSALITYSTLEGGYSIFCDVCAYKMDFDIHESEYKSDPRRWDYYICKECKEDIESRNRKW